MKIAIDCRMSGLSGIGVYLDNILAYLLSLNSNDTYVLIGIPEILKCYQNKNNCTIVSAKTPIFSWKEVFGFPTKEINKCDVFYSPNYNIPFGINIPIYSTIHDIVFLDVEGLTTKFGKFIRWIVLWRTTIISKKIFTVSGFSKKRIQFHFKRSPEIIVTYGGINREIMSFKAGQKSPYEFEYILFIGNIKKHKGLEVLLKAFEQAQKNGFSHKLVIVGEYEHFKSTDESIIKRYNEHENVVFTGRISNEQLYNTISNAQLLVQPSVYEGFGLPPLEALYLGCNVLITDIEVFHEIYGNLPVTFFELNNVDDLSEKIIHNVQHHLSTQSNKRDIDTLFSFDRSAQIILNHLKKINSNNE